MVNSWDNIGYVSMCGDVLDLPDIAPPRRGRGPRSGRGSWQNKYIPTHVTDIIRSQHRCKESLQA